MPASDPGFAPGFAAGFEILSSAADGAGGWALAARVPAESRLFQGHFPGHPIVPGVALLALVARAVADWRGEEGELLGVRGMKLRHPVGPEAALALRLSPPVETGAEAGGDDRPAADIAFELRDPRGGDAVATGHVRVGRLAGARPGGEPR